MVCPSKGCGGIIPIAPAGEIYPPSIRRQKVGCPFCGASTQHSIVRAEIRKLDIPPPTAQ